MVPQFDPEALLHQEMQDLKQRRETLKRQCKNAAKEQKLLDAKRRRLLKAESIQPRSCLAFFGVHVYQAFCLFFLKAMQAAKGLSAEDLQLLLNRAQGNAARFSRGFVSQLCFCFAGGGGGAGGWSSQVFHDFGFATWLTCPGADGAGGGGAAAGERKHWGRGYFPLLLVV